MSDEYVFPDQPFTRDDLGDVPAYVMTRAQAAGRIRRVLRGVYVLTETPDSYDLRFAAVRRAVTPGHIACDRTAAWLHGIDLVSTAAPRPTPPIEICRLRGEEKTRRTDVHGRHRDLSPEDIAEIHGVLVTTPLRTALDLGCVLRRREALAALDQFRRRFGFSAEDYALESVRFFRRRGVVQLRDLIPLTDTTAESPRESWTRLEIRDAGLPAPVPQYEIFEDGVLMMRLDFAYPERRVAVEYDGLEFHSSQEDMLRDRRRRDWLRSQGWKVIVVRSGDFTGRRLDQWIKDLREALEASWYSPLRW